MMEAQSGEKMTAEERSIAGQAVRLEYKSGALSTVIRKASI